MIKVIQADWDKWRGVEKHNSITLEQMETPDCFSVSRQPSCLLDLAAKTTAKFYSSSDIVGDRCRLDEPLLRKVAYWSFTPDTEPFKTFVYMSDKKYNLRLADKLLADNKLIEIFQVGFMMIAYFTKISRCLYKPTYDRQASNEIRVSVMMEKQKIIRTACSGCTSETWCVHVLAALIYRIKNLDKVRVHAPMTDCLSTLDRDQLQMLLLYAVNQDPAEILKEIFCNLDESGNIKSEISSVDGAPDPTCGGLQEGEKCLWDLSLDLMCSRYLASLDVLIRTRSKYNKTEGLPVHTDYCEELSYKYPDIYDPIKKMESGFFCYFDPVLEFIRREEYLSAAEIMQRFVRITLEKMRTITRSDCSNLSRLWHDLSHIHALLVLRTEDSAARNVLMNTANEIKATAVLRDHILQTSDWSELPSLTQLFPHETEKLKAEDHFMIESVLASQLQPNPQDLCRLLDGTDSYENTSYNEDVIVMLARLESLYLFDKDQCEEKVIRLGILILRKLSFKARKDSILGQFTGSTSEKSNSGAPFSLIKLFCPGPSATSTKQEHQSLISSSSSDVEPIDIDSVLASGEGFNMIREPNKLHNKQEDERLKSSKGEELDSASDFVWSSSRIAHAMLQTLGMIIGVESDKNLDSLIQKSLNLTNHKDFVVFCLQALELSRYHMQAVFNLLNTDSSMDKSCSSNSERSMMTSSNLPKISLVEHKWCLKLEKAVCGYLNGAGVGEEKCKEAVEMYLEGLSRSNFASFYFNSAQNDEENVSGVYPWVLLTTLSQLTPRNETTDRQLANIFAEIFINSTHCQVYNVLLRETSSDNSTLSCSKSVGAHKSRRKRKKALKRKKKGSGHDDYHIKTGCCCTDDQFQHFLVKFCTDFAYDKYTCFVEAFFCIFEAHLPENAVLVNKVLQSLKSIRHAYVLKYIVEVLRINMECLKNGQDMVESFLLCGIQSYRQRFCAKSSLYSSSSSLLGLSNAQHMSLLRYKANFEKKFIFSLVERLEMSNLSDFLNVWQDIFTCNDLQDLVLHLEVNDKKGSSHGDILDMVLHSENKNKEEFCSGQKGVCLTPKLLAIIDEFYDSKLPHDEKACTLLTRYFTPGSDQYIQVFNKIITNWENYDCGALFNLAKLQHSTMTQGSASSPVLAVRQPVDVSQSADENLPSHDSMSSAFIPMDQKTFDIVEKAFKRLDWTPVTSGVLEAVEWMCNLCMKSGTKEDITSLPFYDKLIRCVCEHTRTQPKVVLKVLEIIDTITGGISSSYLAQHESIVDLQSALLDAYKEHFGFCTQDCDILYHEVIPEMLAAEMICKKFVPNGDKEFRKVIVQNLMIHCRDKTFVKLLGKHFRLSAKKKEND